MSASTKTAEHVVRKFWELMATNNFSSVAEVLAPTFVLEWPQSNERIRGAVRFARMNTEYPSHGPWMFKLNRLVVGVQEVVTDVEVTDGVQNARAISFFTVEGGKIIRLVEFWPEPYPPLPGRDHLVEPLA
jgi:hypothetical protein